MAPTVHLVRHAQGLHNTDIAHHQMRDPVLTAVGERQCNLLAHAFGQRADEVELVVASPLRRTLYTALWAFEEPIKSKKLRVVAMPGIQETSDMPCDIGSGVDALTREFAKYPVDLRRVESGWNDKTAPKWAPRATPIKMRARETRQWLRERKEKHIVVVTHGGFLPFLTEEWGESRGHVGVGWQNAEFRSYTFDPDSGDAASLVETEESLARRTNTQSKNSTKSSQQNTNTKLLGVPPPLPPRSRAGSSTDSSSTRSSVYNSSDSESHGDEKEPVKLIAKVSACSWRV